MKRLTLFFLSTALALPAHAQTLPNVSPEQIEQLRALYLRRLDAWVATRDMSSIQAEVVGNCGKLMYLRDPSMGKSTSVEMKDTLDFRIDVCTKMTIHRVEPQPEFANPEIIKIICGDMPKNEPVFTRLCVASNLKLR
ncbi:hypothetical protein [Ancylobacter rudongensis]|uniref:hypothetical protein n=1 Tax=Ancylobacter rudongensis TaxID=177413 RepID=UPI00115F8A11|nr:hypothetical protein [Ancylobacter rudongensis]